MDKAGQYKLFHAGYTLEVEDGSQKKMLWGEYYLTCMQ